MGFYVYPCARPSVAEMEEMMAQYIGRDMVAHIWLNGGLKHHRINLESVGEGRCVFAFGGERYTMDMMDVFGQSGTLVCSNVLPQGSL